MAVRYCIGTAAAGKIAPTGLFQTAGDYVEKRKPFVSVDRYAFSRSAWPLSLPKGEGRVRVPGENF